MRLSLAIVLLACSVSATAAPPPPPSPSETKFYDDFYTALPGLFPVASLSALEPFVAPDLLVIEKGEVRFRNREAWFAWLQGLAAEGNFDRASMSREEFFFQPGDRILVREFWYPIKKDVVSHPEFPHKLVSYQFNGGKLVSVEYLTEMRPMGFKPGATR